MFDDKDKLRQFILNNFAKENGRALEDNTSLTDEGLIDSTGVLEIAAFIEDVFGITIEDEEIIPANFESIESLFNYIQSKQARYALV